MPKGSIALACGASLLAFLLPTQAFAQSSATPAPATDAASPVSEIVVTAQRRQEKQVDVPISITALSPQKLATANVQNLGDIGKVTPALRFDQQAVFVQPSIRGIGTGITTSGGGSNIGIYVDGFYSPNPLAADFQLTNVQSIQVLKGPQGTLFGRNTTGGAILVTTADPSETPSFAAKASYGRYDAQKYQGYGTFGIANGVAMDVEGIYSKGHGFLTNIVDDDHHVGAYENWTIRTGLKIQISPDVSVLARYIHSSMNDPTGLLTNSNTDTTIDPTTGKPLGVQTYAVPGLYTTDHNQVAANLPRFSTLVNNIAQLTIKADLGFANLTSYTQYRHESEDQSEDLDQTGLAIFQLGIPITDKTWSQEVLLTSKPGPRLQWTAGAFYFNNQDIWVTDIDSYVNTPVGRVRLGGSGSTTQSVAAFLDATYQLTDKLFLTAGVRYAHDSVLDAYYNPQLSAAKIGVPGVHGDRATPRAVIRYKPDSHSSVYASYTRGYKAAIVDVGGSCQDPPAFQCNPVKPETIDAFELGYKYDTHGFSFEAAGYYYNYRNLQVSEYLGNAQAFIVNAAKSQIYGIEASSHYDVNRHISLDAGFSWNHGRYKRFGTTVNGETVGAPIYASCPANAASLPAKYATSCGSGQFDYVNTDTILRNTHMQHTPDYTANAGARYTTGMTGSGEYSLAGNLYYSSKLYFSPSGTQFLQPHFATLGLRAEWKDTSKRFTVALYGDNVTNERYRTQVQFNAYGIGATWSTPATWGVEAGVKF